MHKMDVKDLPKSRSCNLLLHALEVEAKVVESAWRYSIGRAKMCLVCHNKLS